MDLPFSPSTDSMLFTTTSNSHLRTGNHEQEHSINTPPPPNYQQVTTRPPPNQPSSTVKVSKVKKLKKGGTSMEKSWLSTSEKAKELYRSYFELEDVPKSLRLIVAFYRVFCYSFSGLVFRQSSSSTSNSISEHSSSTGKNVLQSTFFICLNLAIMGVYTWPFLYTEKSLSMLTTTGNETNSNPVTKEMLRELNASKTELNLKLVFTEMGKDEDWHTLKPILRYIIESLRYGFLLNAFVSFLVNLLLGSRILRQILAIPNIRLIDRDHWRAIRLLAGVIVAITGILALGLVMFNRGIFSTLFWLVFKPESVKKEAVVLMQKTLFIWALFYLNFIVLTMGTVLFCYVMGLFDQNIQMVIDGLKTVHLDELTLYKIKNDLAELNGHFKAVVGRCFTIPLTIDMILNTLLLIAASCFLMINQGKERYYLTTVFGLGAFALARLVVVCVAGNAVSNNFRELIREIYEQVPEWDLGTWMCFLEIKAMQEQFEVTVSGGVYTVRQSAILTVLGFALNYIVVLLQTETYGSEGAANATNSTSVTSG